MKKNLIAILALVCALLSIGLSVAALGRAGAAGEETALQISRLEQENQTLRNQLGELNSQLERLQTVVTMETWALEVTPWADNSGADVTFTAEPTDYMEGVTATFLVTVGGEQVVSIPCAWDGTAFTATAGLTAQDGYGYYCLIGSPGGSQRLSLTTPESPTQEIPVYLASSLGSYCNLAVSDWTQEDGDLVLTQAYAQVQLPRITAAGEVELEKAELVLSLNGAALLRTPISLIPSEVAGSFDVALENTRLAIPELAEGDMLELHLVVTLSDGTVLTSYGASWYPGEEGLSSVVG